MIFSQYRDRFSDATGLESSNPSDSSLEVMSVDGTGRRTLFHCEGTSAFAAEWSATRDEIVVSVGRYFRRPGLLPPKSRSSIRTAPPCGWWWTTT